MPELKFAVAGAEQIRFAAAPQLALRLKIDQVGAEPRTTVQAIALRCQIRIEPTRRRYDSATQAELDDLFGSPERWGQTVRSLLWTHVGTVVSPFVDSVLIDLPVPCSFDFNLAATKYFGALSDGEIPLKLLFSGTVFYESDDGALAVEQISWDQKAEYRLPVAVWRGMMDHYYPNCAWLCLRRDVFDALRDYKSRNTLPTWEQAVESLLVRTESTEVLP